MYQYIKNGGTLVSYSMYQGVRQSKAKASKVLALVTAGVAGLGVAAVLPLAAKADTQTVVVTPAHTQGWMVADQRAGGAYQYVTDATSPLPNGALQLSTDGDNASKLQYMHAADAKLSDVTALSYDTKQVSGPAAADPSYQLAVDLNGAAAGGFTTLVYEPYWNGTVTPGAWQQWDVAATNAQLWSSRSFSDGTCTVTAGSGGAPFYSLADLQAACPDAVVEGFGVNVGTYNPNYVVETDGVNFNGTTYDFQLTNTPADKDACKADGYLNLTDESGNAFKNQGQCVAWTNHNNGVGQDDVHAHNR